MTSVAVLCDGLEPSRLPPTDRTIRVAGVAGGNLYMRIQSPEHALGAAFDPISSDLLRIAAYVYGVDQEVSRGGDADLYGRDWQRDFQVYMPVSDAQHWEHASGTLHEVLFALTGDRWTFRFSQVQREFVPLQLSFDPSETLGSPDSVYLLSGGMDSLCAVADAVESGRRPLLVGQSPAKNIEGRRNRVVAALRRHFIQDWTFPDVSAAISRTDLKDPADSTQRSRGFLFATLGSLLANRLGLKEVNLADNGVVSLNLPLNRSVVNTRASRSTHPRFIRLFNELLRSLFENPPNVVNPLLLMTRLEALERLKDAGAGELATQTVSCVHTRLMKTGKDHCGVCTQCIDRRFAMVAAGLDSIEDPGRYALDVFLDELPEGAPRTVAKGYHDFLTSIEGLPDDALVETFSQLYDAVQPRDALQPVDLPQLVDLLRRHSATGLMAVEEIVSRNKSAMARGTLPGACLLRLINPSAPITASESDVTKRDTSWHSVDYRKILWDGEWRELSTNRARVVELLDEAGSAGLGQGYVLAQLEIDSRDLGQLFRGCWAWRTLIVSVGHGIFALNSPSSHS